MTTYGLFFIFVSSGLDILRFDLIVRFLLEILTNKRDAILSVSGVLLPGKTETSVNSAVFVQMINMFCCRSHRHDF